MNSIIDTNVKNSLLSIEFNMLLSGNVEARTARFVAWRTDAWLNSEWHLEI